MYVSDDHQERHLSSDDEAYQTLSYIVQNHGWADDSSQAAPSEQSRLPVDFEADLVPLESKVQYSVIAVFTVASLQMVGSLTNASTIQGLGMVTAASPLPLVLSAHDGLDTFAQTFAPNLAYGFEGSESTLRVEVDPALSSPTDGPFKGRNAYGAVLLLDPLIERSSHGHLSDDLAQPSFYGDGRLLDVLGLEAGAKRVCIDSRSQNPKQDLWSYEVECR